MNITEYKSRVAALGCMACRLLGLGETPAILHHPRTGQGASQRASDWLVIPLCPHHHKEPHGIHGHGFTARTKLTEMDLLAAVIQEMQR